MITSTHFTFYISHFTLNYQVAFTNAKLLKNENCELQNISTGGWV